MRFSLDWSADWNTASNGSGSKLIRQGFLDLDPTHFGSRGEPDALDWSAILGVVADAPLQKPVAVPVEVEMEFVLREAPQVSIDGVDFDKCAPRLGG